MPEVREEIEIEAPPEAVWDLAMDPDRLGEWVSAHTSSSGAPSGDLDEGDSFRQVLCLGGQPVKVRWTLTRSDPPELAEWDADGPKGTGAKVRYRFEAANGGTRFQYENEFDLPRGPIKLIAGKIAGAPARRAARKSLNNLKRVAEAEAG
ncbi:MAG: SRPBCC family protein [Solirubrobacterales bacterium]